MADVVVEPDNPENEPIAPSLSSPDISSWISEIEELLLNSDTYLTEPSPEDAADRFSDDFFADINLPNNNTEEREDDISQLLLDFPIGDEFDEIMGFNVDDLASQESSTPESQFNPFVDESQVRVLDSPESQFVGGDSQVRVLDSAQTQIEDSIPESPVRVVNDGHSTSDSQARVLSNEDNSKPSDGEDDHITKKRKRQMRNRDAAVKSRERKKMYVKDLEVKSRYLEGECIRLQRLLQWVSAENHALHLQLHNKKTLSASRTKQESAVLLFETLLLVSLLWFLGTMGLLPHLEMRPQLKENILESVDSNNREDVDLGRAKSKNMGLGTLRLFFKSKRCKASRSKMKVLTCFGAVVA